MQPLSWGRFLERWRDEHQLQCTGDKPALSGRGLLIRQFPSPISSIQGDCKLTTRPLVLVPNCCITEHLAQDADFQRFLIWRKSLKIPPRMPEVNSFFKASAAQANWLKAPAEIPGPVAQRQPCLRRSALPVAERWLQGFVRILFFQGSKPW